MDSQVSLNMMEVGEESGAGGRRVLGHYAC